MPTPEISIGPVHKDYLLVLAYMYMKNNQLEKAITIYQALRHLFPESEGMSFCLSYLYYQSQQYDTALFYADSHLSKKPSALGFLLKSQVLSKLGRHAEAKEAIRRFLSTHYAQHPTDGHPL
jgi:tetratricopeptide (TPR) repeat protein